jgi:L-threonylcarbamoyladenylate synthase
MEGTNCRSNVRREAEPQTAANIVQASPSALREAAELLRRGKLVAFPTETVYGLGASALDEPAVQSIFRAKGRPATSPLIVHVHSMEMARSLVSEWPEKADQLAARFWPGPLTLVLCSHERMPV